MGCEASADETASGQGYYCNGDPVNGFDPDGRFGSKFSANMEQGYGMDQSASMAFTGTLQDAAVSTGSPFLSYSAGLLNAASLTAGQISSPQVTLPQSFQANYQAYGDSWTALNATINPAFHAEEGAVELYTGMGISPDNMGQTLSFNGRANGLVKMYTGGVGTVGVAMGGVGLTRAAGWTVPARTNAQLVQEIANRADAWGTRNQLGATGRAGTLQHGYADRLLTRYQKIYGDRGLSTEVPYLNGIAGKRGLGSIRLDVVEGDLNAPIAIYDYKFFGAQLTLDRILEIRQVGQFGPNVPITEVKVP
jgi:hypothetical protein